MNKTLFGLALLSYSWETNKKDIIDSYVPLVCSTIRANGQKKVTKELVQKNLMQNYGINIPLGATESILRRMSKNELLTKEAGEYNVNTDKVYATIKESKRDELNAAFDTLVIELRKYAREQFQVEFSNEDLEAGLIDFFKQNDLDLLFANINGNSVLPPVKESKKAKYIIAKYITNLQKENPSKFGIVLKLAKGYAIATLITYEEIQNFSGNLKDVEIFLDAPIVFNLLGLNGDSNLKLTQELVEILRSNGAKLRIFEVNHGEVIKTIQDAINRLRTKNFAITKSSRVLRTAIRENISSQQLQIKLNQVDSILSQFAIGKMPSPSLNEHEFQYQIDEGQLTSMIEELYKKNEEDKIPWYKANQIERDVESISNIFKLRKRTQATSLKNSKAILLTSNEIIAFAAKRYERAEWPFASLIPVCLTDIFLSTILWSNYPAKNDNLKIKQLISECYDIIELDNKLLTKFYEDVKKMHEESKITDEQFYLLNASNLTYTLLEQKTLNDIEEYTDKTPAEILEDLQSKIKADLLKERQRLERIDLNLRKISRFSAKAVFILIAGVLIGLSVFLRAKNPVLDATWFNIISWSVAALLAIFGFLRWLEWIPTRLKIETAIDDYIYNLLRSKIGRD